MSNRKLWGYFLALCLLCVVCAAHGEGMTREAATESPAAPLFEEARRMMTLSGTVVAGETRAVLAPFGGTVQDLTLVVGSLVSRGDLLFTVETENVYAPCDGTVGSVGAQVGDESAQLVQRYGALMYLEPSSKFLIETDTKFAYNDSDNQMIHVGEKVYIGSRNNSERVGVGYVILVDGIDYTVEVVEGNLILDDSVSIFRDPHFKTSSRIGYGTTSRTPNVAITADGTLFKVHVKQGDVVKRGQLLLEVVTGSLNYNPFPTNRVYADTDAIIASVDISAGSSCSKGQTMATLYPIDSLQVSASINEMNLKYVRVGDVVRIELSGFQDEAPLVGTIVSISGLNQSTGDIEAEYDLRIQFETSDLVRLGMSANVYINE